MTIPVQAKLDFGGARRITNLAQGAATGEPVTFDQLNAAIEGLAWKDNVRVAGQVNIVVAAPGATIDGITMVANDGVLLSNQTVGTENGIYVWNGAATPMTRRFDAVAWADIKSAIVSVDEGTSAGSTLRQSLAIGVIGTNTPTFVAFGTAAPVATTGTAGIAALATQAEVDAGSVTNKIVTPATLAGWASRMRKFGANVGDSVATSIVVTHNFNTKDVEVYVYENTGLFRMVQVEIQHTGVNAVTLLFDTAPATNAYRAVVIG